MESPMSVNEAESASVSFDAVQMHKEIFGVVGDRSVFDRFRTADEFHRIVSGETFTIGIRDPDLGVRNRSSTFESPDGCCLIWGEVIPPSDVDTTPARWLYETHRRAGEAAFSSLNGSYVALVDSPSGTAVIPDLLRSRECFYTDAPSTRVFGTDAAQVARCIEEPTIDRIGLNEFLSFGVVFENRTLLEELGRMGFDSVLGPSRQRSLDRIRYSPVERDESTHVRKLASALQRAVRRRAEYPNPKGILSSAGFDSRMILSTIPDMDISYTLGTPSTPEVITAKTLASQYGIEHSILPVTDSYLQTTPDIVQYTNGIRESLHIHHRGQTDRITVQTMYHGLLIDTVLRDIYLPRNRISAFGHTLPLPGLVSNPDPFPFMRDRLGIYETHDELLVDHPDHAPGDVNGFLRETVQRGVDRCRERADSVANAMGLLGLKVTQALPFQTHLADHFTESLVAADRDLIDWHLSTPPRYRNAQTFQRALDRIDQDLLRHRPPDRPHRSHMRNQIEGFLRRMTPLLDDPGTAWPDRDEIYERHELDSQLFPNSPAVHQFPSRVKLRINDANVWLRHSTGESGLAQDVLRVE